MAERSVISVHTKPDVSERLSRLASATQRSKSFLANEAIERYLAAEEQFLATIEQRVAGIDAGEGISSAALLDRFEDRMKAKFDQPS
ncbi:CopG family ribbon-helix-helix protein [Algirhabdus cladophorae]|uniref:CopG family ribbon-helix-helix protein n=1 Tax=Algirhabdus cladophorae TaxID=3377108 RepID=UPI003B846D78